MNNDFMNRVNTILLEKQPPPGSGIGALENVANNVPRQTMIGDQPHMLAYINPQEENLLQDYRNDAPVYIGPDGVPAYAFNLFKPSTWTRDDVAETASNIGSSIRDTTSNAYDAVSTGLTNVFGDQGYIETAADKIYDFDGDSTPDTTVYGTGPVEPVETTILPPITYKDKNGVEHPTQAAADAANAVIDAAQAPVETTNSVVAQDLGQKFDQDGNTIIQGVKNFFTPFDGTTFVDGELQTDNSEYGKYTSVDGETTSNIRPLARAHTVDLEGNLIQPTITTNDDGTTTFDNTAEDGNVYYDDSVTKGQLNPSLYTPGAGGEDFDITMLEQFGDATLSTMAKMFLPGGAFIGTLKNIGNWLIEPSLDDKVVSKVDGKVIYQNSEGQYYSDDSSGDSYLVTSPTDSTALATADTSTSNDDNTTVVPADSVDPADNLVTTNLTETQDIEGAYQRRRRGGGREMLPDYLKKLVTGQVFDEKVRRVVLEDGTSVYVTPENRILSEEEIENTAVAGDIEYIATGETEEVAAGYTIMDNNTGILTRYDNENNIISEVDTAIMGALKIGRASCRERV